jgi:hypothetical protein
MNCENINCENIIWHEYPNSVQFNNTILKIGDCIIYKTRDLPVRIDRFVGSEQGPIGFEFLPWRGERWATPTCSLRGNPRFIICPPTGLPHYGQHIDWDTVKIVPMPMKIVE